MPQVVEGVVEAIQLVLRDHSHPRVVEQTVNFPKGQVVEDLAQERIPERTVIRRSGCAAAAPRVAMEAGKRAQSVPPGAASETR